jgi:hypothetical protein
MEIERNEKIREFAYRIWQEEGCPDGRDVEHWIRAQMIWEEMNRPKSRPKSPPRKGRKGRQPTAEREL